MCLYITSKTQPKKKIATRDLTAYKVIKQCNESVYQHFPYERRKTYRLSAFKTLEVGVRGEGMWSVHDGFHSFNTKRGAFKSLRDVGHGKVIQVIIPKGSYYYDGTWNSSKNRASDHLRIERIGAIKRK